MTAAAVLAEASRAGVSLRLVDGKAKVAGDVAPELLARLREHKAGIVAILAGDACRWCGVPLAWPQPVGFVLGDGSAECHACADRELWRLMAAADRAVSSPDALADPAELTARGEALP